MYADASLKRTALDPLWLHSPRWAATEIRTSSKSWSAATAAMSRTPPGSGTSTRWPASSARTYEVLAPPDLERIFGLADGSIFQGEQGLDQLAFMRPSPLMAQYATPVDGLYLSGAGTHPGGGVMAASGHNAAQRILQDRTRRMPRGRVRGALQR